MPSDKVPEGGALDFTEEETVNVYLEYSNKFNIDCSIYDQLEEKPHFAIQDENDDQKKYPLKCKEDGKILRLYPDESA